MPDFITIPCLSTCDTSSVDPAEHTHKLLAQHGTILHKPHPTITHRYDHALFPSDFMVMDMLNTRNETMILGRPFLVTIHARIDVFNKEISLGIGQDRVVFNMNNKTHNFNTPIGEIYMIKSTFDNEYTSHTSSDPSSRFEKTNDLHNENNYCNHEQGRSCKKPKLKFDINLLSTHFCKPAKQILKGELKIWPTCNPNMIECNRSLKIYGMDEEGVLKKWYCYPNDDRNRINGGGLSFPEFLLVKYGETQEKELNWDDRFEEWCNNNPNLDTPTLSKGKEETLPLGRENRSRFRDMIREEGFYSLGLESGVYSSHFNVEIKGSVSAMITAYLVQRFTPNSVLAILSFEEESNA
ncbi:hypothetical protein Tco_0455761 [Tanacetum coccineum]